MDLPGGLVTFLFTDIEGSTRLAQMLGSAYRAMLTEHRRVLRSALSTGDGVELFTEGDSLFVAFADAGAALRACAVAQRALADHVWPQPHARPLVRMGLHTGFAEPSGGEYASPEVHRAARVAAAAHGGQILCSAGTTAAALDLPAGSHLDDLGLHRLRGFDGRERLFQLVAPGLERDFPRPRTLDCAPHNLPTPVTSFVGRVPEQRRLRDLLRTHRLVTLVGAGGAGKTRLAVEVSRHLVGEYPDGVWFVDLAGVSDPDLVGVAVGAALGLRPEPGRPIERTIAEQAAGRRMLLLLDTSDAHLSSAGNLVAWLLGGGREARVLTTSREPLGLPGEMVWRIPPLSVRADVDGGPSDAVALLLDRASAARGGQPATGTEIAQLDRVAIALSGLPLALELAAARLRVLSAGQLVARLDDLLGTLDAGRGAHPGPEGPRTQPGQPTDDRHRTMRAALTWSYRDLDGSAARLFRWLSVFAGPVDLSMVESLHGGDPLGALATLVDKSLVLAETEAEAGVDAVTYRMLDPIRAYAARELAEAGEEDAVRERHVGWCLRQVRGPDLRADRRPAVARSLYTIDPVADELRGALEWTATRGSVRHGLAMGSGLGQWWRERGLAGEGRTWLRRLFERAGSGDEVVPARELAVAYHAHALLSGAVGEYAEGLRFSQGAEAAARGAGDTCLLARVLAGRCELLLDMGRTEDAEKLCRDVIGWAGREGTTGDALLAVYALAQILWRRGALDQASALLANARPVESSRPGERGRRTVDMLLGLVALGRGDVVAAHDHVMVALRSTVGHGFHARACEALHAVSARCSSGGDPLTAARLSGAAQAAGSRLRLAPGALGPYWREQQAVSRAALGDAVFDAAYAEGAALSLDGAVAVALCVEYPDLALDSARFSHSS
jgi:predicted ATPase/class 3 adenylate cyclase